MTTITGSAYLLENEEVRDKTEHPAVYDWDIQNRSEKTVIVENGLDKEVTVFIDVSRTSDFIPSKTKTVGKLVVGPNEMDYSTLTDHIWFVRARYQATEVPTTGDLCIFGLAR